MKETIKEVWKLVGLLKRGNLVWLKSNEEERAKILVSCQWIFDKLVALGATSGFGEALLMHGKDFLEVEFGLTEPQIKSDIVTEAQRVFNRKAVHATYGSMEAQELARLHGVCMYKIVEFEELEDKLYHPVIEVYGYFDGREYEQGEKIHVLLTEEQKQAAV